MKNKKIIRLTENDLENIVRKIIKEDGKIGIGYFDNEINLINQFYDLLEQDLGYSDQDVEEVFDDVGDEPAMVLEFLSDLLSRSQEYNYDRMIDQKIIELMAKLKPEADKYLEDDEY